MQNNICNIDVSKITLTNIQTALNSKVQLVHLEDTLGFAYISLRDLSHRKQTGAYYTPEKTVNTLIRNLKNCVNTQNKTLCDPCCGTGNFLIGLVGNGVKIENLYGQDIDEINITEDSAIYLDKYNICVRAGSHCAKMLKDVFNIANTCRISLSFYNTRYEVDLLINVLKNSKNIWEEIL